MDDFALKKLLGALILPPTGFLLIALLGLMLIALPRSRRRRRWAEAPVGRPLWQRIGLTISLVSIVLALVASTWPIASLLAHWLEAPYATLDPIADRLPRARMAEWKNAPGSAPQAIVMLTGGSAPDGIGSDRDERIAADTLERALQTARVAKLTNLPILVSGGLVRPSRQTLAEMSRDVIERDFGVRVRWLETQSRDTAENAMYTARILQSAGIRRIILVTSATHMRRSEELFRRHGFEVAPAPYGFAAKSPDAAWRTFWPTYDALAVSEAAAHEMLGFLWYWLTGWPSSNTKR